MGEIIIVDKVIADRLSTNGFTYKIRNYQNKNTYIFLQTPELMKELSQNYDKSSFFVSKNVCF